MNCIILDDEPMALGILEEYIQEIPSLTLVKKCTSAFEAYDILRNHKIDLIFLDIQMPRINGIHFISGLTDKPIIIFTTAHSEYAVEAFAQNAVDYLLKPISFDRFFRAVTRATELYELRNRQLQANEAADPQVFDDPTKRYILVKSDYKSVKINIDDITYIESMKDYVKIFLQSASKPVITHISLKKMTENLPSSSFARIHRSFVVSLKQIQSVTRSQVLFTNRALPIGDNYREVFFTRFENASIQDQS